MPVDGRVTGEWPYVIASYVVTWVVFAAYAFHTWRAWSEAARSADRPEP